MGRKRKNLLKTDDIFINITPLIDVILVILVVFMLVAPMVNKEQIELAQGGKEPIKALETDNSTLTLYVKEGDHLFIKDRPISIEQLTPVLSALRPHFSSDVLRLFYDRRASFGTYQLIKEKASRIGYTQIELILNPM